MNANKESQAEKDEDMTARQIDYKDARQANEKKKEKRKIKNGLDWTGLD